MIFPGQSIFPHLWRILKLNCVYILHHRIRLLINLAINFVLFSAVYFVIHQKDSGLYPTTTLLALAGIVFWSVSETFVPFHRSAILRHLVCLLLPYSVITADIINNQLKNKSYFLSQVFIYFSLGSLFLLADLIMENGRCFGKRVKRCIVTVWRLWTGFLFLFFLLIVFNKISGNVSFDYDAIMAVCQTNFEEARGYFTRLNHRYFLLTLTIVSSVSLIVLNLFPFKYHKSGRKALFCLPLFLGVLAVFVSSIMFAADRIYPSNVFKLMASPVTYFRQNRQFKEFRANYEAFLRQQFQNEPSNPSAEGRFVVIIGESLNRHYMSLYDYTAYDTTPLQRELAKQPGFTVFQRPFSAYAQTIRCLAYMLTNQNQYDNRDKRLENSVSLFDVARYNGFTTRWFSSQGTSLFLDSPTAVLAGSAQYQTNLTMVRNKIGHRLSDMDLFQFLPESLDPKELIVIQLLGSHYPYANVFPKDFMADSAISDYEKSVCYNDLVVKKLFDYFRERDASVILYLSDHSEDVATNRGHDPRLEVFTQVMTEIPFWLYVSPAYMAAHPELAGQLERASNRVFTGDLLFDLLLSLMRLDSSFTKKENDVLSDDYFLNETNARTLGGTYEIKF